MIENMLNKTVLVDKKVLFKYNLLFITFLIIDNTVKIIIIIVRRTNYY